MSRQSAHALLRGWAAPCQIAQAFAQGRHSMQTDFTLMLVRPTLFFSGLIRQTRMVRQSAIPLTHQISRSQGYCEAQQDQPVFVCHSVDELGWCWICADEFSCLCAAQQSLRKVRPIMRPWLLGLDSVGDEDGFGHVNGRSFALSSVQPRHVQTAGSRICFGRGCFGLSEQI